MIKSVVGYSLLSFEHFQIFKIFPFECFRLGEIIRQNKISVWLQRTQQLTIKPQLAFFRKMVQRFYRNGSVIFPDSEFNIKILTADQIQILVREFCSERFKHTF